MATKIISTLIDDIDGSEATETIEFGIDGIVFEIDLNEANSDSLRAALEPFMSAGRRTRGKARRSRGGKSSVASGDSGVSAKEIRAWASSNGYKMPDRGRVPGDVREAFEAAH